MTSKDIDLIKEMLKMQAKLDKKNHERIRID